MLTVETILGIDTGLQFLISRKFVLLPYHSFGTSQLAISAQC